MKEFDIVSYFDPEIYNLDNLHEADRREAEYWRDEFLANLDGALDLICDDETVFGKLQREIIDEYIEAVKEWIDMTITEFCVSRIDNYEDEYEPDEEEDDPNE